MSEARTIALNGMLLRRPFSGVEGSILGLANALAQKGQHNYRFFIPSSCPASMPESPRFTTERVHIPESRLARLLWEQLRLPRAAEKRTCDLIHAPAYLAPLSSRVPIVLTVYDLQALLHPDLCTPLNRINYRMMLPRSIRSAQGIITPSTSVARDIARLFPSSSERTTVIPLGINPAFRIIDSDKQAPVLKRHDIAEPFILFAGNMAPNKNLTALVRAFAIMKRSGALAHKLVLAGRNKYQHRRIQRCIRNEGLSEEVICTGYVPESDLVALYNAADVFLFPSLYEGFGLPPLEAMACGTPVVCSDINGLNDTAGSAAMSADPRDPAAIAQAIRTLLADRHLHSEMTKKGLTHAKSFTWENARLQTEAFYEKILTSDEGRIHNGAVPLHV